MNAKSNTPERNGASARMHGTRRQRYRLVLYAALAVLLFMSPVLSARIHGIYAASPPPSVRHMFAENNIDGGIAAFEAAVRNCPEDPVLRQELAMFYEERAARARIAGDTATAARYRAELLRTYREACADFPENLEIAVAYASFLTQSVKDSGSPDYAESRAAWTHCLDLFEGLYKENPSLSNNMCRVLPLLNLARIEVAERNWDAARALLERAVAIEPESKVVEMLRERLRAAEGAAVAS